MAPISGFGYKCEWLAIQSEDFEAVAEALGFSGTSACGWNDGLSHALETAPYLTRALDGFIFCIGRMNGSDHQTLCESLQSLSILLDCEVFYFGSHRVVDYYAWARFSPENPGRAYVWADGGVSFEMGDPTDEEMELDYDFGESEEAFPSEELVLELAGLWSVDPDTFEDRDVDIADGLLRTTKSSGSVDPKPAGGIFGTYAVVKSKPWWRFW